MSCYFFLFDSLPYLFDFLSRRSFDNEIKGENASSFFDAFFLDIDLKEDDLIILKPTPTLDGAKNHTSFLFVGGHRDMDEFDRFVFSLK
ncbi:MAG: hypothetical protein WCS90_06065 [Bacilli bacterium]